MCYQPRSMPNPWPGLTALHPEYETLGGHTEITVDRQMDFRGSGSGREGSAGSGTSGVIRLARRRWPAGHWACARAGGRIAMVFLLLAAALPSAGRTKDKLVYGEGLIVNIALPESEVEQVVQDVAENGVIRGTKEYNKDEFISGAKAATTSHVFTPWKEAGKVFYKVREQAIDPRNFKDSSDIGTLAVRYVVVAQGKNTVLRIDALFEEDFRHVLHPSDGSVESNEYKDIREHLDGIELMKRQNAEATEEREERLAKKRQLAAGNNVDAQNLPSSSSQAGSQDLESPADPTPRAVATPPSEPAPLAPTPVESAPLGQTLEERVKDLRKQVERLVRSPGAPLKSAPFHTASTLQLLGTGTEVLIVISTPYWYGVETHDGQHGWITRDQLELP